MSRFHAVIYIRHDLEHPDKQEALCLRHAETLGLQVVALCHNPRDCHALMHTGAAGVVVSATDDAALEAIVSEAGGRLEVARPARGNGRIRREVAGLVQRMDGIGLTSGQMSKILDMPTTEIRRAMSILGIAHRPGRHRDRSGR